MEKNILVKAGIDLVQHNVSTEFADIKDRSEQMKAYNEQLVEINGGKEFNLHSLRNGVANGLFEIIETILDNTVNNGLSENAFFQKFVDYRNVAAGDENDFHVPDNSLFAVSKLATGNYGVRRQRINKGSNYSITTELMGVKTYAELRRLLAGRINIEEFVEKVGKSLLQDRLNLVYTTFLGALADLPAAFVENGAFVEDTLLGIIEHVEAASGKTAIVVGTKTALRKITVDTTANGETAKTDKYALGYYGTIAGTDVMVVKQDHVVNTFDFAYSTDDIWIVVGDEKPVKFVTEGQMIMHMGDMFTNADATVDVFAGDMYGAGVVLSALHGQYRIS